MPEYINPLGKVYDIRYNVLQDIKKKTLTTNAQEKDQNKKNKSNKLQLMIWSIVLAIIILIFLILLRNIK
tara:strand:+ start:283 stop:492 length:210 start_codon:yes stop_codon:yes gene_type:complete